MSVVKWAGALLAVAGGLCSVSAAERPNVVLVMTDDQGYGDLGVHENPNIRTPNLDRFFQQGIEFTRFYVSPVCAPTRASLMTGRYYYRTGVIHTSRGGAKMHGDELTVAEILREAGYRTGIFGKWHLGDNFPMRPQDQGFQECLVHKSGGIGQSPDRPNSYFDPWLWHNGRRIRAQGYCTDVFFDAALRFIRKCTKAGRPFFVYLPTNAPHAPLEVADSYCAPYREMGLNDTTAKVYGMVTNIDENFGRLLSELDRLGLREQTIVIFLCDNGPQQPRYNAGLRGRKASTYEGGIRVPFALQWKSRLPGRRRIDRIAAHIDLLPTLLDLCGIPLPRNRSLDGISLRPLIEGVTCWPPRRLFFQCHRGLTPKRYQNCAVVTQRFKLVGYPGTFSREDLDTAAGKPVLELYDLMTDPSEQRDLASRRPDVVATLRTAYDEWFDSVSASRHFQPGVIAIGSPAENPTVLCRYQDSTYRNGRPH
ncbi:MAG: arylsulfatase, partial [Planctomycetes bacterium]|nr:arylsulfatase [Planctomycetota bacterium]